MRNWMPFREYFMGESEYSRGWTGICGGEIIICGEGISPNSCQSRLEALPRIIVNPLLTQWCLDNQVNLVLALQILQSTLSSTRSLSSSTYARIQNECTQALIQNHADLLSDELMRRVEPWEQVYSAPLISAWAPTPGYPRQAPWHTGIFTYMGGIDSNGFYEQFPQSWDSFRQSHQLNGNQFDVTPYLQNLVQGGYIYSGQRRRFSLAIEDTGDMLRFNGFYYPGNAFVFAQPSQSKVLNHPGGI